MPKLTTWSTRNCDAVSSPKSVMVCASSTLDPSRGGTAEPLPSLLLLLADGDDSSGFCSCDPSSAPGEGSTCVSRSTYGEKR